MTKTVETTETFRLDIEALAERDDHVNILVYGESGAGKTTFASTAPRPILWLEAEGGTHSIGDKKGIDVAKVSGIEDYREALKYLEANEGRYETVVIDSLSETQEQILRQIMKRVAKDSEGKRNEFSPQLAEWNMLTGMMRELVRAFRDLPVNSIFTALIREDTDEMTARKSIKPGLTPRLASEVPAFMDVAGFLYAATPKKGEVGDEGVEGDEDGPKIVRNMLLKPTGKYLAKIRAPKGTTPPDFVTDPSFDKVAELVLID